MPFIIEEDISLRVNNRQERAAVVVADLQAKIWSLESEK